MLCPFGCPFIDSSAEDSQRKLDLVRRPPWKTRMDFNGTWVFNAGRAVFPAEPYIHLYILEELIFLNGRNVTIPGLWASAAKVSQSETFFSDAGRNLLQPGFQGVAGFNVTPNSTLPLLIENLKVGGRDNKMKVIEIVSC
ncbi:unnamed protein product [Cladocopium goreaui]|uniref:Uncharacterized protein n=1 Tax=Cladocopium goreaui TaxID=2562237 RepID=A0A9P1GAZ6_9DINO|nr:unnamed protein product [Cladocopium goreaui]